MSDDSQLFALVRLDREYLKPRTAGYSGYDMALRCFTLTELFEAYFWIELGVELGAFRIEDARLLVRHRFAEVFHDFPSHYRQWGYLIDSQLFDLFQIAMNQNEFFKNNALAEFQHPKDLIPFFQSALRMQRRFADSTSARIFLSDLNFQPETILKLLRPVHDRAVMLGLTENATYFEGFVQSAEYMGNYRQFYVDLLETETIIEHDRYLFNRRVKQLQAWRLNFQIKTNKEAFLILCDRANEFLPSGAALSQLALDPAEIKRATSDLMTDWGLERTMSA